MGEIHKKLRASLEKANTPFQLELVTEMDEEPNVLYEDITFSIDCPTSSKSTVTEACKRFKMQCKEIDEIKEVEPPKNLNDDCQEITLQKEKDDIVVEVDFKFTQDIDANHALEEITKFIEDAIGANFFLQQ